MTITAFQPDAFQNNAFQILEAPPPRPTGRRSASGGGTISYSPLVITGYVKQSQIKQLEKIKGRLILRAITRQSNNGQIENTTGKSETEEIFLFRMFLS